MIGDATLANASPDFWLDSLKDGHAELLGAIDELERLTHGPKPKKDQLVSIRWSVSRASLSRRLLWGRIHAYLSRFIDADVERTIPHLQQIDIAVLQASAQHVSRWSAGAITDDWPGYCQASEVMRRKMTDAIAAEKRLLYPILEALKRDGGLDVARSAVGRQEG